MKVLIQRKEGKPVECRRQLIDGEYRSPSSILIVVGVPDLYPGNFRWIETWVWFEICPVHGQLAHSEEFDISVRNTVSQKA